jgi:DNA helicase-2/ATP-dependent DNA helicase PcrA
MTVSGRPDAEHDAVVACRERHQVVVAPPGTGKTYVSVRLAGALAAELAPHARVLLLTFSRQARAQLEREAARQLAPALRARIEVTNYHRLCWQAVQAYRRVLGLPDELDVGSSRRRATALKAASAEGWNAIKDHSGLADSLAEHAFEAFRDRRTPPPELLQELLVAIDIEQRQGRLVFDDLGALFWRLLETQPTVARAYTARYSAVIADEHQDASALQDALVRRFGVVRLVVLADHMQLIHGFRGADLDRLRCHWRECDARHELKTSHRWNGRPIEGTWLLALRDRLRDQQAAAPRPAGVRLVDYPQQHAINGALFKLKVTVPGLLRSGHESVAVLVRENTDLARVRNYLILNNMRPRQLGGPKDFEEARHDIEQLPLLTDANSVALHAHERLLALVPSVPKAIADQLKRRLRPEGPKHASARPEAASLLIAFDEIYRHGPSAYFHAMDRLLATCGQLGYHFPRADAARAIRQTAAALMPGTEISEAVAAYGQHVAATYHQTPQRTDRGLFLMTAHQAKGKEFDAVVVVPLDARRWPDDDEHRRLLYVALTRATQSWTLIAPSTDASPMLMLIP